MSKEPRGMGASLILGGGGFIGINLARGLAARGVAVRGFGRTAPPPEANYPGDWRTGEFSDRDALLAALEGVDQVYHLVGSADPNRFSDDPAQEVSRYLLPTLQLFDLLGETGVRSVVFVSSGGTVYGPQSPIPSPETAATQPISMYGASKVAIEAFIGSYRKLRNLDARIARVANPFGPWQVPGRGQGFIANCLRAVQSGQAIEIWGDGSVVRDFIYIDDVVAALIGIADHDGPEWIFNVGSGLGRSIANVAADIASLYDVPVAIDYRAGRPADIPASVLDISRISSALGWQPRSDWRQALLSTRSWVERHEADAKR